MNHRSQAVFRVALTCAAFAMSGCTARTPVRAPAVAAAPLPAAERTPYRLQVGDQIAVLFWGNSELDQELLIRPDGAISLPFVDDVMAAGLTPAELDAKLSDLYKAELAAPEITVILRDVGGQEIFIGGEVEDQGVFPLRGRVTLYQAIQIAGGFKDSARRKEVVLIRTLASGERVAAKIDMMPLVSGSDPQADIPIQPADIVFVPRSGILNFTLFLQRYFFDLFPIRIIGTVDLFDEGSAVFE